jgi:hypothetical protein
LSISAPASRQDSSVPRVQWPDGKRFAFTVVDDTDLATLENVSEIYALLGDLGFRTTKTCWPLRGDTTTGKNAGQTCQDEDYRGWLQGLQVKGFEIGWHGASWQSSSREETLLGLETFASLFGHYPHIAANHTGAADGMYWAEKRLTGVHALLYKLFTRMRNQGCYQGDVPGSRYFWGDLCRARIKYFRNFAFQEINTLKACPRMPYHDPLRPLVNAWFAASNGVDLRRFNDRLAERHQDQLEEEGGACIMYTHFAFGFQQPGGIDARFRRLMERLAKKDGWFVPTSTLLDFLLSVHGSYDITPRQRARLERRWCMEKLLLGTT